MSRREQSDRHIIWSNMNLEADDWRDSYKEYLEINGLDDDPDDENKLYEYMVEAMTITFPMKGKISIFSFLNRLSLSATSADGMAE